MPTEAFGSKARQRDGQNHDHGDHRAGDQPTHENLPFIATKWRFSSLQQSRGPESRPAKGFLSSPEDDEKSDGAQKPCSVGVSPWPRASPNASARRCWGMFSAKNRFALLGSML